MSSVKLWRESASLIVLARTSKVLDNGYNYKVLAFNRSERTSFMPNHTVYPGGACDTFDESADWISYFKNSGVADNRLAQLTNNIATNSRPAIFQASDTDNFKKEISLRITAIRETFEELGILICRKKNDINQDNIFGNFFENFDRAKWQETVHNDPKKFLDLCQELEVVPDLWSLYEWSVWLTPAMYKRRFETAFFVVALNKIPNVIPEHTEVLKYFWNDPDEYLKLFKNDEIWLPPPQLYEFGRLTKLKDIDAAVEFAKKRNTKGVKSFHPIQFLCSDGIVSVLVGDDFYPEDPCQVSEPSQEYTNEIMESVRLKAKHLHRVEMKSANNSRWYLSFEPFNEHLSPELDEAFKNKL